MQATDACACSEARLRPVQYSSRVKSCIRSFTYWRMYTRMSTERRRLEVAMRNGSHVFPPGIALVVTRRVHGPRPCECGPVSAIDQQRGLVGVTFILHPCAWAAWRYACIHPNMFWAPTAATLMPSHHSNRILQSMTSCTGR